MNVLYDSLLTLGGTDNIVSIILDCNKTAIDEIDLGIATTDVYIKDLIEK
jgi:hypothetical protein